MTQFREYPFTRCSLAEILIKQGLGYCEYTDQLDKSVHGDDFDQYVLTDLEYARLKAKTRSMRQLAKECIKQRLAYAEYREEVLHYKAPAWFTEEEYSRMWKQILGGAV